jgi:hypothetical protein
MEPAPESGAPLDHGHHVLRYVGPRLLDNGTVDGGAFLRKPKDVDGLSVNWLEWFPGFLEDQVTGVRQAARLTYSRNGGLARLNVGRTTNFIREHHPERLALLFVHNPLLAQGEHLPDQSHSLITEAPFENAPDAELLGDLIARCVIAPVFPAVPRPQ